MDKKNKLYSWSKNISQTPLVDVDKILLPPLHIKLGFMKNFVKAMNRNGEGFLYLKYIFSRLREANLKEGILVGPDLRKVIRDSNYITKLSSVEKNA